MNWWKRRRPSPAAPPPAAPAPPSPSAWPQIASAVTLRLLGLTELQREVLDTLQRAEDDPRTLELLYRLDHGNAQTRRLSRGLQVLAGEPAGYGGGRAATMLDVVGMATAMVGQYQRVRTTGIADGIAPAHFAEDLGLLLAELLDNGTRYGGRVTVGAHRMASGTVAVHARDGGSGCSPDWMARVNAWLAGPVRPVGPQTGRHSGLTIVHHLARRHGLQVNFSTPPPEPGEGGTLVTVYVPAGLLPEDEPEQPAHASSPQAPPPPPVHASAEAGADTPDLPRRVPGSTYTGGAEPEPAAPSTGDGGTLADLAAAFSPAPEHQERP